MQRTLVMPPLKGGWAKPGGLCAGSSEFVPFIDMPLTRLDIFASQNRYMALPFDMPPLAARGMDTVRKKDALFFHNAS